MATVVDETTSNRLVVVGEDIRFGRRGWGMYRIRERGLEEPTPGLDWQERRKAL